MTEWIDVKERMPEAEQQVLVAYHRPANNFRFHGLDFRSSYGDLDNEGWFRCEKGDVVTDWLPLPALPERGEEG